MYKTLLYEKTDRIARITLNRPERLNAIDSVMMDELEQAWVRFREDDDSWVAILTGAGERAFCVGADLAEASGKKGDLGSPKMQGRQRKFGPMANHIYKPVIVAVNGLCVGGGLQFVAEGDIVVCSDSATFMDTHTSVGQVCAMESIGLTRRMPVGMVMRLIMMGKAGKITAQRAYEVGLASEVVKPEELMQTAQKIAETVLEQSPNAIRLSKEAIIKSLDLGLEDAWELGHFMVKEIWGTEDQMEGPRAFAEKRKPRWKMSGPSQRR